MESRIIYEVLRVMDGKPIFFEEHITRMRKSFELINVRFDLSESELYEKVIRRIEDENKTEGNIKITYEVNSKKIDIFFVQHNYPTQELYDEGVKTILYFGERENPNAKIVNNEFRNRVNNEIIKNNAYEAILVDRNGYITEGSKSNIFMIKDGILLTSPTSYVLPGITRGKIIEIAKKIGIVVKEIQYSYKDIDKLDGMFICGTSPKVLPVKKVENTKLNNNNKYIRKIMEEYNLQIINYIKKH